MVWRHGQTAWNAEHRFQGHIDVDLDDVGRQQADRSARLLAALEPAAIISSDLRRAEQTAEALAVLTGLPVGRYAGLRETYAGAWQGLVFSEIAERFPAEMAAWNAGADVPRGGDGETLSQVGERALGVVRDHLDKLGDGQTLVVVTHGGTGRAVICRLLDLPRESWAALGSLANCSWSVVGETPICWRLLEHNAGSLPEPVLGDDR